MSSASSADPEPDAGSVVRAVQDAASQLTGAASGVGVEIERKFLVAELPEVFGSTRSSRIEQGYLALDPEGAAVRLRRYGKQRLITVKGGHGIVRAEEEWRIVDAERFERLWALTAGRRVEKVRHLVPAPGGLTIEVDVYEGALEGLVTAEVEGSSHDELLGFQPPAWITADVSHDGRYANARLATHGIPNPAILSSKALAEDEPAGSGLQRVALTQLDQAAVALRGASVANYGEAVHGARKTFKRLRAIARVAAPGLPADARHEVNARLREAGQLLSGARDARVVVDTLDEVLRRRGDRIDAAALRPLREALVRAREQAAGTTGQEAQVTAVLAILDDVRCDVEAWSIDDEIDTLVGGFKHVHHKGRKALAAAGASKGEERTEALHELRKRSKDLWHGAELLEAQDPDRLGALAERSHDLADLLGDDHDLAVLAERAAEHAAILNLEAIADLNEAIAKRRTKLDGRAQKVAAEIYGHKLSWL